MGSCYCYFSHSDCSKCTHTHIRPVTMYYLYKHIWTYICTKDHLFSVKCRGCCQAKNVVVCSQGWEIYSILCEPIRTEPFDLYLLFLATVTTTSESKPKNLVGLIRMLGVALLHVAALIRLILPELHVQPGFKGKEKLPELSQVRWGSSDSWISQWKSYGGCTCSHCSHPAVCLTCFNSCCQTAPCRQSRSVVSVIGSSGLIAWADYNLLAEKNPVSEVGIVQQRTFSLCLPFSNNNGEWQLKKTPPLHFEETTCSPSSTPEAIKTFTSGRCITCMKTLRNYIFF